MRCTSCGLPLSPARTMTSCPRCGTPIVSEKKSSSSPKQGALPQGEAWQPLTGQVVGAASGAEWGGFQSFAPPEMVRGPMRRPGEVHAHTENDRIPTSNGHGGGFPFADAQGLKAQPVGKGEDDAFQPGGHVHAPISYPSASPAAPVAESIHVAQPAPELDPMWLPAPASSDSGSNGSSVQSPQAQGYGIATGMRTDEQLKGFPQGAQLIAPLHSERSTAASQRRPWQPRPPKATIANQSAQGTINRPVRRGNSNLGFLVAGLCVITGGLMLFFIYFMALGAPDNSNGISAMKTRIATNVSPIPTRSSAASPVATPFPGQRYIDHAQMASRIDPASRQAVQLTTTFKANQNIYVTFQLHPAGQNGAVCLFWYANNRQFATYQLQVVANEQSSYSYATYKGIGSGYVELYWASTTTCTDKILAQHVNFTVTA